MTASKAEGSAGRVLLRATHNAWEVRHMEAASLKALQHSLLGTVLCSIKALFRKVAWTAWACQQVRCRAWQPVAQLIRQPQCMLAALKSRLCTGRLKERSPCPM